MKVMSVPIVDTLNKKFFDQVNKDYNDYIDKENEMAKPTNLTAGTFTSKWEHGEVTTAGTINPETKEIVCEATDGTEDLGCLLEEEFTTGDGTVYEVCPECSRFAMTNNKCADKNCH